MTARPPLVGIDLRIADAPGAERTGLGRYALEVSRGLLTARPDWRFALYSNRPELLPAAVRATRLPTSGSLGRLAWLHSVSRAELAGAMPDVWFSPAYVVPVWWRGPSVVAVHDLSFLLRPELYRGRLNAWHARTLTRRSARRASVVLCGTETVRAQVVEHLGIPAARIEVVRYGVTPALTSGSAGRAEPPFVLFLGTWEARKGLEPLAEALEAVNRTGTRLRLVLAGRPGWGADTALERLAGHAWAERLVEPDDARVATLLRDATALVYPSELEGFGLPVAEALAAGCPVVASDIPELREWVGERARWAPVGDAAALAGHLEWLLEDPVRARRFGEAGRSVGAALTWARTAEGVAEAIEASLVRDL